MMLGGFDPEDGAVLYFIDYLGSLVKNKFYAYGYGGYVGLSVIDRYYGNGGGLKVESKAVPVFIFKLDYLLIFFSVRSL